MARGFDLSISWPDIACVTPEVGKFRQHTERFVQPQNVFLGLGEAPSLQRGYSDGFDVGIGFPG